MKSACGGNVRRSQFHFCGRSQGIEEMRALASAVFPSLSRCTSIQKTSLGGMLLDIMSLCEHLYRKVQ